MIIRKSAQEIAKMAAAGRIVAETIAHVGEQLEAGVTTGELDRIAEEHIRARGGTPTSQGYRGFPGAICISPNAMVVHGIPGLYEVVEGDLVEEVAVVLVVFVEDEAQVRAGELEVERLLLALLEGALRVVVGREVTQLAVLGPPQLHEHLHQPRDLILVEEQLQPLGADGQEELDGDGLWVLAVYGGLPSLLPHCQVARRVTRVLAAYTIDAVL